jgi:hypothetical protein
VKVIAALFQNLNEITNFNIRATIFRPQYAPETIGSQGLPPLGELKLLPNTSNWFQKERRRGEGKEEKEMSLLLHLTALGLPSTLIRLLLKFFYILFSDPDLSTFISFPLSSATLRKLIIKQVLEYL